MIQVDLKKVVEHVCDTAGHLLKPRVSLEKMVDQTTPSIAGDGSRIVQVCIVLPHDTAAVVAAPYMLHILLHLGCSNSAVASVAVSIAAHRIAPWFLHLLLLHPVLRQLLLKLLTQVWRRLLLSCCCCRCCCCCSNCRGICCRGC